MTSGPDFSPVIFIAASANPSTITASANSSFDVLATSANVANPSTLTILATSANPSILLSSLFLGKVKDKRLNR
jgi:hypothetical protein